MRGSHFLLSTLLKDYLVYITIQLLYFHRFVVTFDQADDGHLQLALPSLLPLQLRHYVDIRSEEHTSELQSRFVLLCSLLVSSIFPYTTLFRSMGIFVLMRGSHFLLSTLLKDYLVYITIQLLYFHRFVVTFDQADDGHLQLALPSLLPLQLRHYVDIAEK